MCREFIQLGNPWFKDFHALLRPNFSSTSSYDAKIQSTCIMQTFATTHLQTKSTRKINYNDV